MNSLIVCALLLVPTMPTPASMTQGQSAVSVPAVIVRLGEASLEEYKYGDPASRVSLLRGGQNAKNVTGK